MIFSISSQITFWFSLCLPVKLKELCLLTLVMDSMSVMFQ